MKKIVGILIGLLGGLGFIYKGIRGLVEREYHTALKGNFPIVYTGQDAIDASLRVLIPGVLFFGFTIYLVYDTWFKKK